MSSVSCNYMVYGGGHKNGRQTMAMYGRLRERGLWLWPRLNADPVCDDSAAEEAYASGVAI